MASTSNPGGEDNRLADTIEAGPALGRGRAAARATTGTPAREPGTPAREPGTAASEPGTAASETTAARKRPRRPVRRAQAMAERAVLVPIGASLVARDNLIGTVKSLAPKYATRSGLEREVKRYERRGVTARSRFERQVRHTRSRFENEVRERRSNVEEAVRENRRRFEREVWSIRQDLEGQSGAVTQRVDKLVSDAQGLIGNSAS